MPAAEEAISDRQPHARAGDLRKAVDRRLADEVKARRAQLRLPQGELADLAGVSECFVYALENGKQTAQLDKVRAVLNALGLNLEIHRRTDREIR